ncbi:MAG: tRNA (adenosine(37)-N6)-dimethylallyltransferase MiaA [Acidimicrobiia bacterium]
MGATASGKSAIALAYASEHPEIEIVSMDSMQVYRGMDIGTAKPTRGERAQVPHHMIDVADPHEDFSVARFQIEARAAIVGVEQRGHRALLVGGTGLYLQAVIDDLRFPGEDLECRARIDATCETDAGLTAAYARLEAADPVAASRIEPANRRRIARALEVIETTGRPFSSFGAGIGADHAPVIAVRIAGLTLESEPLTTRLEARVRAMLADGWVDEVRALAARPEGWSRTARQAIGYRELDRFVREGAGTIEALAAGIVVRSRQFARRQRAWYRRTDRVHWVDAGAKTPPPLEAVVAWWEPA